MNFLKKIFQHLLCHLKIGNYSINQWTDSDNMGRCSTNHSLSFLTDGQNLLGFFVNRNNRRLGNDNTFAFNINQRIGSTEVNANIVRQPIKDKRKWASHTIY